MWPFSKKKIGRVTLDVEVAPTIGLSGDVILVQPIAVKEGELDFQICEVSPEGRHRNTYELHCLNPYMYVAAPELHWGSVSAIMTSPGKEIFLKDYQKFNLYDSYNESTITSVKRPIIVSLRFTLDESIYIEAEEKRKQRNEDLKSVDRMRQSLHAGMLSRLYDKV